MENAIKFKENLHDKFVCQPRLEKAVAHCTCTAYCKGSPTVQIFHLHLGHQQLIIYHSQTFTQTNTREGTHTCVQFTDSKYAAYNLPP